MRNMTKDAIWVIRRQEPTGKKTITVCLYNLKKLGKPRVLKRSLLSADGEL